MKIGLFTDILGDLSLSEALDWIAAQGIEAVELGTGGFSAAPHCDVDRLLRDEDARGAFSDKIESHGLILSALNCNSNPLDPHPERGQNAQDVLFKSIELAQKLDIDTVVTMSGCPGDPSGSSYPNWATHPWQPEFVEIDNWQWDQRVTPFWKQAGQFAADHGIRIAIEMHPGNVV